MGVIFCAGSVVTKYIQDMGVWAGNPARLKKEIIYMSKLNNTVMYACNEGGHFAQMLALKDLFHKYETVILTDNIRANRSIPALRDVKEIEFAMSFANKREELTKNKDAKMTHASYLGSYWGLTKECWKVSKKHRPKVIISTGSNIAVPLCFIAKLIGAKFVYIETRAKVYNKTISGKIVGRFADKVIVQWPEMVEVYKGRADYYGTLV